MPPDAVYIKKNLLESVREIQVDFHHGVFIHFDSTLFGKTLVYGAIYLPPENSCAYDVDDPSGMQQLEEVIEDLSISEQCSNFLISGDLNARTNHCEDYIPIETDPYLPGQENYFKS